MGIFYGSHPTRGMRYFEDLDTGERVDCGERTLPREEIVAFAERWDPQPFHVDEAAAAETRFGDIIASGLHTLSVCNLLSYREFMQDVSVVAGRGIDDMRFPRPVSPGDTVSVAVKIEAKETAGEPPGRGLARFRVTGTNQHGDRVISYVTLSLVRRQNRSDA